MTNPSPLSFRRLAPNEYEGSEATEKSSALSKKISPYGRNDKYGVVSMNEVRRNLPRQQPRFLPSVEMTNPSYLSFRTSGSD